MAYTGQQQQWQQPNYQGAYGQQFQGPSAPPNAGFNVPPSAGFHVPPETKPSVPFGQARGGGADSEFEAFEFSDKTIRRGFIRKVYSILMVQLLVTVAFIALFLYNESARVYAQKNTGLFIAALVINIVLIIALACCEGVRRKMPTNFICLGLFTVSEGFLLGVAASTYKADAVLLAAGITTVICLALTAFSFQTKWDFTAMGGMLFVALVVFFIFSILAIFLRNSYPIVNLVYACLGALLFSAYLVYDTQLMMGGKHKYSISPEEYVFAALNLYLDIVQIFLYILQIIGSRD